MLNPEDMSRLSRLLDQALALAPEQREAWLAALPPEAADLAAPLRTMLSQPLHPLTLPGLGAWEGDDPAAVHAGDRIGPYRLLEEIGRGGMGSVWRAERADGSYQREVALKLPRLTWGEGLARLMAQERDIGAMLEHPNIARLYDAGIDARGWPYLALELVAGQPIDAWCRERGLGVDERLTLLLQVMRAVGYAHGRLVVHRDIKPSNVLVTPDGQAHLLDFGIAKLLSDAAAGAGLTHTAERRLTPHYASPEQLRDEPVTVATDVYSLGVLAFELLTGHTPYRLARASRAAWEEAMLADEPERASSRCEERATARALRGDLDAILAKALRRDPAQRYASVDAFAQDLQRHLRGEAVLAQPDSAWYRLGRTLRRHRLAFSTGAIVIVALAVGGGLALRQSQRAELAAQRQRVLTGFAAALLQAQQAAFFARTDARHPTPELTLADSAMLIQQRFPHEPDVQAELLGAVAGLFLGIDQPTVAAEHARRQHEALLRADAPASARAAARLLAAEACIAASRWADAEAAASAALALAGKNVAQRAEALAYLATTAWATGRSSDARARLADLDVLAPASSIAAARSQSLQADIAERAGRIDAADIHRQHAISIATQAVGTDARLTLALRQMAAHSLVARGRLDAAQPLVQSVTASLRRLGGHAAIEARIIDAEFAGERFRAGQLPFFEAMQAMDAAEALIDAQPARPVNLSRRLGHARAVVMLAHGDIQVALPLFQNNGGRAWGGPLSLEQQLLHRIRNWNDMELTTGLRYATPVGAALKPLREQIGMSGHPDTAADIARAALTAAWAGDSATALALLEAAGPFTGTPGPVAEARRLVAWVRAQLLLDLDRGADAAQAVLGLQATPVHGLPAELFSPAAVSAQLDCAQGRPAQGRDRLLGQAQALLQDRNPAAPRPAWLRGHAGLCALAAGDRIGALALADQARQAFKAHPEVAAYFKQPLARLEKALARR